MALPKIVPPLEYLRQASPASLQSFELSRLNHAANLRREIAVLIDQWIQESSEAMLARWMLEQRNSLHDMRLPASDLLQAFLDPSPTSVSKPQQISTEILPAPPRFADSRHPVSSSLESKPQKRRSTA
jgi:hypothetical protein